MSRKRELSKLALTAFLLATMSPTTTRAAIEKDAQSRVFFAANYNSLSAREEIADNSSEKDDPYNPKYNTYQMKKSEKSAKITESSSTSKHLSEETIAPTVDSKGRYYYYTDEETNPLIPTNRKPVEQPNQPGTPSSEGKLAYGMGRPTQADNNFAIAERQGIPDPARASSYYNSYNVNHGGGDTTQTHMDSYTNPGYSNPSRRNIDNSNLIRQYNPIRDYDYNRSVASTVNSSQTLNEAQLLGALNPQGRAIYLSLDPEGKALAIQLASEDSYKDKNLAIKEAQRRMNDRFGLINRY